MNILLNRDSSGRFKPSADGMIQIAKCGEFYHAESKSMQVIDQKSLDSIVARFNREAQAKNFAGKLVDYDHFSYDPEKESRAAGWINRLEARGPDLFAAVKWSEEGENAINNGAYRFISPTWLDRDCESLGGNKIRPLRLDSVALTNKPNLTGMAPVSNREGHRGEQKQKGTNMESVNKCLGLAPEASEAATLAAVTALQNRAAEAETQLTPLKNRVGELETAQKAGLETQIETDLEAHKNRITPESKEAWRTMLRNNRAEGLKALTGMVITTKAAPAGAMHNRETAQTPASVGGEAKTDEAKAEEGTRAKKIANRAHEIATTQKVSYGQAWDRAKGEFKAE